MYENRSIMYAIIDQQAFVDDGASSRQQCTFTTLVVYDPSCAGSLSVSAPASRTASGSGKFSEVAIDTRFSLFLCFGQYADH